MSLLVVGPSFTSSVPLPGQGRNFLVGRAEESDLQIRDASVSRRHAMLRVEDTRVTIEDLGSFNGTRVAGRSLGQGESTVLPPGLPAELGLVLLIVRFSGGAPLEHAVQSSQVLMERLAALCRQSGTEIPFALLRLRPPASEAASLEEKLLRHLRVGSLVARLGSDDVAVLLPETSREEAVLVAQRLEQLLGGPSAFGMACYPRDARTLEDLLAQAEPHRATGPEDGIVILDSRMREIHRVLEKAAASSIPVLLLGETGAGKEILAERLHRLSSRAKRPLLRLNCAAFSESLLEAELFGYERGAFTGATTAKPGLLEVADGGTVFLDEVGELPPLLQAKLLRVLEDSQVRRVGALKSRTVDVRVVSATNRDLDLDCNEGRFRRDLFFRINGVAIEVPPLRERRAEILALGRRFLDEAARRAGRSSMRFSPAVEDILLRYTWPGNVRELRHAVEHAVMMANEADVSPADLPDRVRGPTSVPIASARLRDRQEANEREVILEALREANGNQTRAAKILGIARSTLVKRLELHDLPRPRKD